MDAHWYNFERLPENDNRCAATLLDQSVLIMVCSIVHLRVPTPTQIFENLSNLSF